MFAQKAAKAGGGGTRGWPRYSELVRRWGGETLGRIKRARARGRFPAKPPEPAAERTAKWSQPGMTMAD